jgi:PAS domain S-box-containing protein
MRLAASHMAELEQSRAEVERQVLERTRELAVSETRFRMLASSAPIGIYASDAAGEIVFANPRWSELSGLTIAETLGMGFVSAVHPDDLDGLKAAREATLEQQEPFHHSFRLLRRDGEVVWVNVRAAPLCEPNGSVTGYVGTVEDIGIFKRAEAELIRAREVALDAARLKSEFLANVSHEIRTPMNGIIGLTDLMLSAEHTDEQREYLTAVRGSAEALMRVVGDILDFSRIEAGTVHIRAVPFCLRDTFESVVHSLAMRAKEKSLALSYEIDPEVPDAVVGDPGRVRQVLLNLLGNAIKFTERGSVQASVRCVKNVLEGTEGALSDSAPNAAGFVQLEFSVRDTGIGIPDDKQKLIFEAFRQGDGSTTRRHGGTGLGLAIGSQLAELMGGYIRVESALGTGSTFRFTVPFQLPEEAVRPEPAAPVLLPEGPVRGSRTLQRLRVPPEQALRVLLAEDQSVNRILATRILEMLGHVVTAVEDGTQVMARLKSGERYDVLVLDISMPLLDGYETTSAIRARESATPWAPRLPIIALTAHALPEDRDRCMAAGMDGYASKPFKAIEVMAAIEQARRACGRTATVAQSSTRGRRAA